MSNKENASKKWHLERIEIELHTYGPNKGKYLGRIKFSNSDHESFSFNLSEEMANTYIKLIASEVVSSAETLGNSLVESLGITTPCEPS